MNLFKTNRKKDDIKGRKEENKQGRTSDKDETRRKYETLFKEVNDIVEVINPDGVIKYISPSIKRNLGFVSKDLEGENLFHFFQGEQLAKLRSMVIHVLNNPRETVTENLQRISKSGETLDFEVRIKNMLDKPWIRGLVITSRNISFRIGLKERLDHTSTHDDVTMLPNKNYLCQEIQIASEAARKNKSKFILSLLDMDDFQYINHALGYSIGDKLILDIGQRLNNYFKNQGLVCHYSGDQFGILLKDLAAVAKYENILAEIIDLFNEPFIIDQYEINVTTSVGASIYPDDGEDMDSLFKHASIALFHAKNEGKNRYKLFSEEASISSYKEFELKNDLHKALKNGEFTSYFQPIVNVKNNRILAAEALIRWEHPNWGLVTSDEFISIAEETGFIIDLGRRMLEDVCRHYKEWLDKGLPRIKISLNYSSAQFFEENFLENVEQIIRNYGLDPNFLIIEVEESVLRKCDERIAKNLKKLQDIGVEIAIDDFGRGFLTVSCLESFDIDYFKITSDFLKDVPSNITNSIIVKSIVNMAHELKTKLVVKGIENWGQLSFLKGLNCYAGQGYIFSKALPSKEFERLLRKRVCKPIRDESWEPEEFVERRKFFRVKFHQFLEATMTILELNYKKVNVGDTLVLIKNMGPGGLCFVSNINLPIEKNLVLQFTTQLVNQEIKVVGSPVWTGEIQGGLYEYGVEFNVDENQRAELIKILNLVQIKMRNNILFAEGRFVSDSLDRYFKAIDKGNK